MSLLGPSRFLRVAFSLGARRLAGRATPALAEKGKLRERLTPEVMAVVFPGAERLGPEEGTPPAIAAYKDGKVAAYIFSTLDIIAAPGYSTTPFDVIAGVDVSGRITGAKVVFHASPISITMRCVSRCSIRSSPARPGARCAAALRRRCSRISSRGRPSARGPCAALS